MIIFQTKEFTSNAKNYIRNNISIRYLIKTVPFVKPQSERFLIFTYLPKKLIEVQFQIISNEFPFYEKE